MNDIFSFQRFALLFRKFWKEHIRMYLLYLSAMAGVLLLFMGFTVLGSLHGRFPQDTSIFYYVLGLLFMGSLFASSFYGFFGNKAKAIRHINLPASTLEKILLGFLFTQVFFFLAFSAIFYAADHLMVWAYNHLHTIPANVPPSSLYMFTAQTLDYGDATLLKGVLISLIVTSLSHFGSLCFEKNIFAKNALIVIILGVALVLYSFHTLRMMIPEESMPGGLFFNTELRIDNSNNGDTKGMVYLPDSWTRGLNWLLPVSLYLLLWSASFFKLKEKQV